MLRVLCNVFWWNRRKETEEALILSILDSKSSSKEMQLREGIEFLKGRIVIEI
jgi:hypothetical protein